MHEMSLCESILRVLEEEAGKQGFSQVNNVWLEVGRFAGVEIDALRFSFEVVVRDTLADGAGLEIIELPGAAWCEQCAASVEVSRRFDPCPQCGGYQLQVTGGDDLKIKELEVT